jgi:radical SAM protein with 4Fe4S-binding SPASM domain
MVLKTRCGLGGAGADDARVSAPDHTTAARLGVQYSLDASPSDNPNKSPARTDDGSVSSFAYAQQSEHLSPLSPQGEGDNRLSLDYHHPLEDWLGRPIVRRLLDWLSRPRDNDTVLERIIVSYRNRSSPLLQRIGYWPFHKVIDWIRKGTPVETFRQRVAEHRSTVRGLVVTARSVAEFGLTLPQRFSSPLFAVWNFTNRCNLACQHCYQDAEHRALDNELTLDEKLDVVDQAGAAYMAMIALAGGEPTISPHLLPVLRRCQHYGIHVSVATNGTTMTPKLAGQLAEVGAKYIEISLDSVDPDKHDRFRGQPGMWKRTVEGMKTVVATPGLRLGIAMCVHQGNFDEVERMIQFAVDIGAGCFAHFNFIPVGRGLNMTTGDLTPAQRESLLLTLNKWMQSGKIGVLSTAPQLGRVCLTHAPVATGLMATSHAGSSSGWKTRVVAKYLGGCGAGRTYVCIEPAGDVTPCVYLPHRVMGNVRQRPLIDIFRDNPYGQLMADRDHRRSHCEVCQFKHYCGGCLARSDAYYGQLNAGDPGCLFNDKHWDALVCEHAHEAAPV